MPGRNAAFTPEDSIRRYITNVLTRVPYYPWGKMSEIDHIMGNRALTAGGNPRALWPVELPSICHGGLHINLQRGSYYEAPVNFIDRTMPAAQALVKESRIDVGAAAYKTMDGRYAMKAEIRELQISQGGMTKRFAVDAAIEPDRDILTVESFLTGLHRLLRLAIDKEHVEMDLYSQDDLVKLMEGWMLRTSGKEDFPRGIDSLEGCTKFHGASIIGEEYDESNGLFPVVRVHLTV